MTHDKIEDHFNRLLQELTHKYGRIGMEMADAIGWNAANHDPTHSSVKESKLIDDIMHKACPGIGQNSWLKTWSQTHFILFNSLNIQKPIGLDQYLSRAAPSKRRTQGAYYTPKPIVDYILRRLDEYATLEWGLSDGIASEITWAEYYDAKGLRPPSDLDLSQSVVRFLEPSVGDGAFLLGLFDYLKAKRLKLGHGTSNQTDTWMAYASRLTNRIYAKELNPSAALIAQLRVRNRHKVTPNIWVGNALDGPRPKWRPTIILGNPPYKGESSNNGDWIRREIDAYRYENGKKLALRQSKWLQNDYVKFFALAQAYLRFSPIGSLGYITDHSYLDGIATTGLRLSLQSQFNTISIVNLHGNALRREKSSDGTRDESVLDIAQGTAIFTGCASDSKRSTMYYGDLLGKKELKFKLLDRDNILIKSLRAQTCNHFFVPNTSSENVIKEWKDAVSLPELFKPFGKPAPGFLSGHDQFAIAFNKQELISKINILLSSKNEEDARRHFRLCRQSQWNYDAAKEALASGEWKNNIISCLYRPMDKRWTCLNKHILIHARMRVTGNLLSNINPAIVCSRVTKGDPFRHVFISNRPTEVISLSSKTSANAFVFPRDILVQGQWKSALKEGALGNSTNGCMSDIFAYITAVLHSNRYRSRYAELLRHEFPKIPHPKDKDDFQNHVSIGKQLISTYCREDTSINMESNTGVIHRQYKYDHVAESLWLGDGLPKIDISLPIWEYKIGGYAVLQQWIKRRVGQTFDAQLSLEFKHILKTLKEIKDILTELDQLN